MGRHKHASPRQTGDGIIPSFLEKVEYRRISAWDQEERDLRSEEKIERKKRLWFHYNPGRKYGEVLSLFVPPWLKFFQHFLFSFHGTCIL